MSPDDLVAIRLTPFRYRGRIPDYEQDDLREAMLLDARKMPRPGKGVEASGAAARRGARLLAERAAKRRAEFVPEVRRLLGNGLSATAIAQSLRVSRNTVRRVIKDIREMEE